MFRKFSPLDDERRSLSLPFFSLLCPFLGVLNSTGIYAMRLNYFFDEAVARENGKQRIKWLVGEKGCEPERVACVFS